MVGFDDIEATRYVHPSLTAIRQPMDEIGQVAVDMLMKQVYGREVEEKARTFEGRPGRPRIMLVAVVVGIGCPKDLSARAKVSSGWIPIWCNCKTNVG